MIYLSNGDFWKVDFLSKNIKRFGEQLEMFTNIELRDRQSLLGDLLCIADEQAANAVCEFVEAGKALKEVYFMKSFASVLPEDRQKEMEELIQTQTDKLQSSATVIRAGRKRGRRASA